MVSLFLLLSAHQKKKRTLLNVPLLHYMKMITSLIHTAAHAPQAI